MEKKLKEEDVHKDKIRAIKKSGREFFMEVVFELCFGGRAAPEPALIKLLLNTVFVEKTDSTQELTPYKNAKADKIPIIRSFLLHLLLEHRYHDVYLDRASCMIFLAYIHACTQHGSSEGPPEGISGPIVSCSVRKSSNHR
jgi:hypothetical protein